LDRYGPPKSLVQALEAMTIEQKGHIQQLVEASSRRRTADLRRIARGLVASLPDEDQPQVSNCEMKMKVETWNCTLNKIDSGGTIHPNDQTTVPPLVRMFREICGLQ
jgi:hypothetical protein